jgi:hypothetical protein
LVIRASPISARIISPRYARAGVVQCREVNVATGSDSIDPARARLRDRAGWAC